MKTKIILFIILLSGSASSITAQLPKVLIMDVFTEGVNIKPSAATATLKIEVDKTKLFAALDRNDVATSDSLFRNLDNRCYNLQCLLKAGEIAGTEKVFSGSVINLGSKIAVTIKLIDVKTGVIEKVEVGEFIILESEVQNMIRITLNNMFGIKNEAQLLENLVYYQNIEEVPTTKVNNNGPRMGIAFVGGSIAERLMADEKVGGYGASRVFSQIGYQFEGQYMSSGNLQALGEVLFMVSGLDQQLFIPSMALMNGFRMKKSGWEIAFGPSFKFQKKASGYFDNNNNWHLAQEWNTQSTDSAGNYVYTENPYEIEKLIDRRGLLSLGTSWVWALGKTFRSGYLNIPVNLYFSKSKDGWFTGLSFGFNIKRGK